MGNAVNLSQLSTRNYGLLFLNYTGIPTIIEDLIIREAESFKRVPILLIWEKYIKERTIEFVKSLDIRYLTFSDFEDLFTKLNTYEDEDSEIKTNLVTNALKFHDINCFTSTIYYHSKQFQIETIKDVEIKNQDMKYFFRAIKDLYLDNDKVKSFIDDFKVDKITINNGNQTFGEIIKQFGIPYKESRGVDCVLNPDLQIGRLNQGYSQYPLLLSNKIQTSS